MKRRHTKWAQRLTALTGALTLGLFGLASPATAQVNIEPDETGSLTIQKFEEPETATGLLNDGTEVDTTGLNPLAGVEFTVQQVGDYDLTTDAGWEAIEGMTPAQAAEEETLVEVASDATGTNGQVVFDGLDLGLYLVTETGQGDNLIPNAAAPFLVTMPMPHSTEGWLYDIYAYPKNSVTAIDKTLDDADAYGLGDTIAWTVTADIPQLPDGETFSEFAMSDELDAALEYEEVRILAGGDTVPTGNYETTFDETTNTLTVSFSEPDGLNYLAANQGSTVAFEIDTAVTGIGTITNVANISINGWDADTEPVDGTDWGSLDIFKHTGDDEALSGAEFQIFTSQADANDLDNPVEVGESFTFTSGTDGSAFVDGLRAGTYWVVETEAPAGYIGVDDPIEVTIEAGDEDSLDVANAQRSAFELPLTGGIGTWLFVLIGVGVAALAIGLGVRHQRAKRTV